MHALALMLGSTLYVSLFAALLAQPLRGAARRLLLGLVSTSGAWYLGRLAVFYLPEARGISILADVGGWSSWPIGLALCWYAWRAGELRLLGLLLGAGTVSGLASAWWPLGSFPTVVATLPAPLGVGFAVWRDQVFGLFLPRRALMAAGLGLGAGLFLPLAAGRPGWLVAGAVLFLPLFQIILNFSARAQQRKLDAMAALVRGAAGELEMEGRRRYFEEGAARLFGLEAVSIGASGESGYTHEWALEHEGRRMGTLYAKAARLEEDAALMAVLASEIAHSLASLELMEEKLRLERALAGQRHLAALGQVSAAVAHEIKNPLSAIKTIAQLLREDAAVEESHGRDLEFLVAESSRLAASVQQLLGYSRPVEAAETAVDLSSLASAIAARQRIRAEVEPGLWMARSNPELLSQIVWNLTTNALQADASGGVELGLTRTEAGEARLTVRDLGPGLTAEARARLFEPFFTTRAQGTGLGLAIVKKAVDHLRGRIEVESGAGATAFTVTLPGCVIERGEAPQR